MNKFKVLGASAVVGVVVALIYWIFEFAVHQSINLLWNELFNTNTNLAVMLILCVTLTLIYFGAQHKLAPQAENKEPEGLGLGNIQISANTIAIILFVGYLSLIAGASLGPEAVLTPACVIAGMLIGKKWLGANEQQQKLFAAAGIVALFAAFFSSFIVGLLTLLLIKKLLKAKITPVLLAVGVLSSGAATLTLNIIDPKNNYFTFPDFSWAVAIADVLPVIILVGLGYVAVLILKYFSDFAHEIRIRTTSLQWWQKGLMASFGLSVLYALGGELVRFTGNQEIQPMLNDASTLGLFGLVWVFIIKLAATGWSRIMGYRGGLIFPMIFVISVLVAMAQLYRPELSYIVGLLAGLVGMFAAERKAKILF